MVVAFVVEYTEGDDIRIQRLLPTSCRLPNVVKLRRRAGVAVDQAGNAAQSCYTLEMGRPCLSGYLHNG